MGIIILFDTENNAELYHELQEFVAESTKIYLTYPHFNDAEIALIRELLNKERMNSSRNFNIQTCAACDGATSH
jgi:predicted aconitase